MKTNLKNKYIELEGTNPMLVYFNFIYKNFGRSLLKNKGFKSFFYKRIYLKKYESILKKANLKILPEEYFISIFISIVFTVSITFILTIFFLFLKPIIGLILFYTGILLFVSMGLFMYNYPIILAKSRGDEINASMPYLLPYLKILSKELSLAKIIDLIDDFLIYKEIKVEFRRIKYYYEFLGYDIHSSIREAMDSSPSRELSDLMNDLVTISNSGGDIYLYLDRKLENLNKEIEAIEKKSIDTLLIFSQVYVVVLLISPLFFTIMSTILNLIDFSGGTKSSSSGTIGTIILLLVFLPIAYIGFMFLIYYSKPLYSRLTPIKN